MTRPAWQSLMAIHWRRARASLLAVTLAVGPLCLLFAHKSGYRAEDILANVIMLCAFLPFGVGSAVAKSKADGSLAFLASLPVSAAEHVRAWLVLAALLATPLVVAVTAATLVLPLGLPAVAAPAIAVTTFAFIVSVTLAMLAVQLSKPPAGAGAYLIATMSTVLLVLFAVGKVAELTPTLFSAVVRSPYFVPGLSVILWGVVGVVFWRSCHRIGHYMTSYVGDPPQA
ncbi:hypothetical protein [Gemmatimonas sp.]|jgi:hypothetical protein|uniref:hypothetical protein n=1 Tax=Gemmatimonas sp. TaxID=1962908 RepID=UPI0022C9EF4F|nr:hypothetical protein [Gemmatimonas sp.]MCZ8206334.1 hypothetical protein [Gemmatimonas sp.]